MESSECNANEIARLARRYRRVAYAFFGTVSLALMLLIIVLTLQGYFAGTARDPFTGQAVQGQSLP